MDRDGCELMSEVSKYVCVVVVVMRSDSMFSFEIGVCYVIVISCDVGVGIGVWDIVVENLFILSKMECFYILKVLMSLLVGLE